MKFSQLLGRAALFLIPLFLLILIAIYGVNVPFWDEWSIPGEFLIKDHRTFADYFSQSNESRLIVPKLLFLAVSKVAGWQPKHYMYLGWLIMLAILALTYRLCYWRPFQGRAQDATGLLCLVFSSAILFSPAQYENWLWGLQWVIFVPLLCALLACDLQRRTSSFALRLLLTVTLNLVGMFSFSNGMILWIVSFPFWREVNQCLAGRRPPTREVIRWLAWTFVYVLSALLFIRIYFTGYKSVFPEPPLAYALKEPWKVVKYFVAWCGGPIHANGVMHIVIGSALLLAITLTLGAMTKTVRRKPATEACAYLDLLYPSILIMVYALGSGAMTAIGRAFFGFEQAYSSRYLFHSGTLWVGFIAALNTHRILTSKLTRTTDKFPRILFASVAVFSFLLARTWNHFYKQFAPLSMAWQQSLLSVRMIGLAPKSPMTAKTCPWVNLPALVHSLTEKGLYDPSMYGSWLNDAVKHPQSASGGRFQILPRTAPEVTLTGWAISPKKGKPADAVLICYRDQDGQLTPSMMLAVGHRNNEVVRETGKASLTNSGFLETFAWPEEEAFSSAELFAVDETGRLLYPLTKIP